MHERFGTAVHCGAGNRRGIQCAKTRNDGAAFQCQQGVRLGDAGSSDRADAERGNPESPERKCRTCGSPRCCAYARASLRLAVLGASCRDDSPDALPAACGSDSGAPCRQCGLPGGAAVPRLKGSPGVHRAYGKGHGACRNAFDHHRKKPLPAWERGDLRIGARHEPLFDPSLSERLFYGDPRRRQSERRLRHSRLRHRKSSRSLAWI